MLGRGGMLLAGWPTPLSFRAADETNNSGTIVKPAGVAAGDLVVIVTGLDVDPTITTASGGDVWSKNSDATQRLFWKILTAHDVANNWGSSSVNTYASAAAWSNQSLAISSVTIRSAADSGPNVTTLTVPGFAPSGSGKPRTVIAAISTNWNAGSNIAAPSPFTARAQHQNPNSTLADMTVGYSGQSAAWTGLTSGAGNTNSGWLVEVH